MVMDFLNVDGFQGQTVLTTFDDLSKGGDFCLPPAALPRVPSATRKPFEKGFLDLPKLFGALREDEL